MGYRQAVRHQVLILAFPGSNPGIPATSHTDYNRPLSKPAPAIYQKPSFYIKNKIIMLTIC